MTPIIYPPIQIVDESDRPIRGGTLDEVQLNGLWHRIARVMVEDPNGKILLQLRAGGANSYPNRWDNSAAGHVDEGEDFLEAAARELYEEIGLKSDNLKEAAYYKTHFKRYGRVFNRFNKVYVVTVPPDTKFTLEPTEVSEVRWFAVGEVKALMGKKPESFTDGAFDAIKRLYS